jgi:hypothetical protein
MDKVWFHFKGYINTHIIETENPHIIRQTPLNNQKVGVWCAVNAKRIIGSVFSYDALNSKRYVNNILEPVLEILTEEEKNCPHFNGTVHQHTPHQIQCQRYGLFLRVLFSDSVSS